MRRSQFRGIRAKSQGLFFSHHDGGESIVNGFLCQYGICRKRLGMRLMPKAQIS